MSESTAALFRVGSFGAEQGWGKGAFSRGSLFYRKSTPGMSITQRDWSVDLGIKAGTPLSPRSSVALGPWLCTSVKQSASASLLCSWCLRLKEVKSHLLFLAPVSLCPGLHLRPHLLSPLLSPLQSLILLLPSSSFCPLTCHILSRCPPRSPSL